MLAEGKNELICDLAETYHVMSMKAYPPFLIATLAAGLRPDARIIMKLTGRKLSDEDSVITLIYDRLNWLCWTKTKDAEHKKNMPESLYEARTGTLKMKQKASGFSTPEEFERKRKEIIGG